MDIPKLLIADGSKDYCDALSDALCGTYRICTCQEGYQTLELWRSFQPDVVVLDLMLPGLDGITLLQTAAESQLKAVVLASSAFVSVYIAAALDKLGVGYLVRKPCDVEAITARLEDLSAELVQEAPELPDPRSTVSSTLSALGFSTKLRGYYCLREAILLMSQDSGQSLTKELYPAVAAVCGGSAIQVERAIRSAIQAAWDNRDEAAWKHYFHPDSFGIIPRPTNGSFITNLADTLALSQQKIAW